MSLWKFSPPQDLEEDTQLSDKGEEALGLSRRNLTKASSWWQAGAYLGLRHTQCICIMLVPGDMHPALAADLHASLHRRAHRGQGMSDPQKGDGSPI